MFQLIGKSRTFAPQNRVRGVAQLVSAPRSGRGGRMFESSHPDGRKRSDTSSAGSFFMGRAFRSAGCAGAFQRPKKRGLFRQGSGGILPKTGIVPANPPAPEKAFLPLPAFIPSAFRRFSGLRLCLLPAMEFTEYGLLLRPAGRTCPERFPVCGQGFFRERCRKIRFGAGKGVAFGFRETHYFRRVLSRAEIQNTK